MTVVLEQVTKSFGDVEVLRALDVTANDGEFLVLLGASGSGKSTALRMIAGLEETTSGRVLIGDRDVTRVLPKNRDVAMVFQSYALYPHKTVAENVGYPLRVRGLPKDEIDRQVGEVAAQVQLGEHLERYPRQLSGGQRQRVALARAMVRRPAAFLMDEPLSNLDAKLRGHMRAELKRMQHDLGITTVYVTHDQVEAMTLADRVAVLEQGVLQQLGTPRAIYEDPANLFVAGFIGSPPMNLLAGRHEPGAFVVGGRRVATDVAASLDAATFGIRAEDCTLVEAGDGVLDGRVWAFELLGDHCLVTVALDGAAPGAPGASAGTGGNVNGGSSGAGGAIGNVTTVTVKTPKDLEAPIDAPVGIAFAPRAGFVFDARGERVRAG